jgi:HCOMODA/2-hydroxy-3-carboxy-muconic semialdehyde decarboxylase
MNKVTRAAKDLVIANRILANLGLMDEYGDVSVRHPSEASRFLLARPRSPSVVTLEDIIEFAPDGTPCAGPIHDLPRERFIHAAIYEARPDITAVVHASPEDIMPFGITPTPLRPMVAAVGDMGMVAPVWDIAERFGDRTDLAVSTLEQGRDLARRLGSHRVAVLRGEGFIVTGRTLNDAVRLAVYVPRSGRTIIAATPFGTMIALRPGECEARLAIDPESNAMRRGWEFWARQAGCGDLLGD